MMSHTPITLDALESRRLFAATLTAGTSVTTGIKTAGVQKNWSISLTAGQSVVLAAGDNSSSFNTELILIAPNGKAIARSSGATGGFIGKTAPVTGTYRVRVRDVANTHTASVTVTAFFTGSTTVADGDDGGTAQSGRRFAATIGPGDLDVWAFTATKGAYMNIVANENDNGAAIGVGVLLVGTDGVGISAKLSGNTSEDDEGVQYNATAAKTGTYYAVVYEPGADATGRYGFSIGVAPGTQTTEDPDTQTPLLAGTTRTGALPSGDQDVFQLSIGRGDTATFSAQRTSGTTIPEMTLVDPTGKAVFSEGPGGDATGLSFDYTATLGGTYSLILSNFVPDVGGGYSVSYTRNG